MNVILRDLINTREVAIFMDNVLIRTEDKKQYDEIGEDIKKDKGK